MTASGQSGGTGWAAALAQVGARGLHLPSWLQEKQDRALAEVSRRVDKAGLLIREGILANDTAAMDTFRLPAACTPFTSNRPVAGPGAEGGQR